MSKKQKTYLIAFLAMILVAEVYLLVQQCVKANATTVDIQKETILKGYPEQYQADMSFFNPKRDKLQSYKGLTVQVVDVIDSTSYDHWRSIMHERIDFEDRQWRVAYGKDGNRHKRYGVTSKPISFRERYTHWTGKQQLSVKEMEETVRKVYKLLPHISTNKATVALLVGTAITESNGGYYIQSKGGDYGIYQIRVTTYNDLMQWLKAAHADIHDAILKLYNDEHDVRWNLKHNIPLGTAVCITEYWRKGGPLFHQYISDDVDRGVMWKSIYNTHKGAGTVNAYINRVNHYQS